MKQKWIFLFIILTVLSISVPVFTLMMGKQETEPRGQFEYTPEYDRFLQKIVLSVSEQHPELTYHKQLLQQLPDYTEVFLLCPDNRMGSIQQQLAYTPFGERVTLVPYKIPEEGCLEYYLVFPEKDKLIEILAEPGKTRSGTLWAQDLFIAGKASDGKCLLLVSDVYKWFRRINDNDKIFVESDNTFLNSMSEHEMKVHKVPITFHGGNIYIDESGGKRTVFCGVNVIRKTITVQKSINGRTFSPEHIKKQIQDIFYADEVFIVGSGLQPSSLLFHLDQAAVILPEKKVGIIKITDLDSEKNASLGGVRNFLEETRLSFKNAGYTIIDIYTTADNIRNHQHYVNVIPFVNKETGERTLFMPVFQSSANNLIDKEFIKKNTRAFESLGYKVVHIPSEANRINGGIHCLVNVLE